VGHKVDPEEGECSCGRTHLRWRVEWRGAGSGQDSWEPASYLDKLEPYKVYNASKRLTAAAIAQARCERAHPARVL